MIVIVIDDDPNIRRVGALALRMLGGFQVMTARSGADGILLARVCPPDVILLDLMMPEEDGQATLKQLQAIPELASVPVILFTAKFQLATADKWQALGAIGIIQKPFDPMRLPQDVLDRLRDRPPPAR